MLPRVNILGVGIHAVAMSQAIEQISNWVESRDCKYVSVCTVHTVMEAHRAEPMRQAVNGAGLATPDGMPLVWLGRWRSHQPVTRVYGPDLMLALASFRPTGEPPLLLRRRARCTGTAIQSLQSRFPAYAWPEPAPLLFDPSPPPKIIR